MKLQSFMPSRPAIIALAVAAILALVLVMVLTPKASPPRRGDTGADMGHVVTLPYVPPPEPRLATPPPSPFALGPEAPPLVEALPPESEPALEHHAPLRSPDAPIPYEDLGPPGALEAPWAPEPPQAPQAPEAPRA